MFDQWYNEVEGINDRKDDVLKLTRVSSNPLTYSFSDSQYFPIDGELFGNEGNPHNYHFTSELHTSLSYHGAEKLTFKGDDDVWVFINRNLVVDLGGVHPAESQTVDLDSIASTVGLRSGNAYDIDIFQAERHTTESVFSIAISYD